MEEEAWSDDLEILQFRSINASNAGEYYCKVKNDVGESESQKIMMNVIWDMMQDIWENVHGT